jgi:hypothetical protein
MWLAVQLSLITPASFTAQDITTLVSVGDLTGSSIAFAATGDQLLVYQGDNSSPSFITAANFDGAGWSDAVSSNTSALPTGLTEGVNAVDLGEIDNGAYDCSTSSDNAANLLSAACNAANWNLSNSRVTMPNL